MQEVPPAPTAVQTPAATTPEPVISGAPETAPAEGKKERRTPKERRREHAPRTHATPAPASPAPAAAPVARTVSTPPAAPSRPAVEAPGASGETHVVRPGESLWSIAKRLAGPGASAGAVARLTNTLWQLNAATIRSGDPDLIHVGDQLRLPAVQ